MAYDKDYSAQKHSQTFSPDRDSKKTKEQSLADIDLICPSTEE